MMNDFDAKVIRKVSFRLQAMYLSEQDGNLPHGDDCHDLANILAGVLGDPPFSTAD